MTTTPVFTSGDIAAQIGQGVERVRYILRVRTDIKPIGRAGIVRLFDESAIEAVRQAIEAIDLKANVRAIA